MALDPRQERILKGILADRQRCRTDLFFLAREILQYKDIEENPHRQLVDALQKFDGGQDLYDEKKRIWIYKPTTELWSLTGPRFRLILFPRGHLKALRIDTPIPTPDGFKEIGCLNVGDKVFSSSGAICEVTSASEPEFRSDVYEVEFSTGDKIICDAGHLWLTDARKDRDRYKPHQSKPSVKTTHEILASVMCRHEHNHRICLGGPLDLPDAELPVEPYTLGLWLGDGTRKTGNLTIGDQDAEEIVNNVRAVGTPIEKTNAPLRYRLSDGNKQTMKSCSTAAKLREIGVLNDKHIPISYLRSSFHQRLSLLQGLMDSDGSISKEGQCSFQNTNARLTENVRALVCTLGLKASKIYSWPAKIGSKICGVCYAVTFYTYPELPVFRLNRKIQRIRPKRKVSLQNYRQIVSVKKSEPCWVRCIAVDSHDSLYLAGEGLIPTHNTTLITMSHTIQWILNYADIRILISTAIGEQAIRILSEIKAHFQFNPLFRAIFPDFCPASDQVKDFGSQEQFTVPNRKRQWLKEPTVSTSSLGKVISSYHYDCEKFSDMVDKENVKTPNQIRDVIEHINYCDPLLERSPIPPHHGWKDIEGTRYAIGDAYGDVIRKQRETNGKQWVIIEQSAEVDPDKKQTLWPTRFPWAELKRIETEDAQQYASQYLMRPLAESSALATEKELIFFPSQALKGLALRLHATVDLHGMEANAGNDYTVFSTCGFDRQGRVYVLDIRRGHFSPFDVINHIFDLWRVFRGGHIAGLIDIKVEKDAHARVLGPFFERECIKRQIWPNTIFLPRSNKQSKHDRIRGLQAWFKSGAIRFSEDLSCKAALLTEILNFGDPSTHDDILDTLADQMQNRDKDYVEADILPRAQEPERNIPEPPWASQRFIGFDDYGQPMWKFPLEEEAWVTDRTGL